MTARTIRTCAAAEALSTMAAGEFVRCARESTAARGRFTVALSGSSTPRRW